LREIIGSLTVLTLAGSIRKFGCKTLSFGGVITLRHCVEIVKSSSFHAGFYSVVEKQ